MLKSTLVGSPVILSISDPWDLASENGEAVRGRIIDYDDASAAFLVVLERAIKRGQKLTPKVLAKVRHRGVDPRALHLGAEIGCNFYGVSETYRLSEFIDHGSPKDAIFFIGGIRLTSAQSARK